MKRIANDAALAKALCGGDEAALEAIINRYTAYVYTIVRNIVDDSLGEEDVKEIVSDVFFTLWKSGRETPPRNLKGFLARIARSRAVDALRRRRTVLPLEEDMLELPVDGPETEAIRQAEYAALRRAVDSLPEPDRTVFLRHYFLYQPVSAVAEAMRLNVSTVKTKLRRGRDALRRELEKGGYFIG